MVEGLKNTVNFLQENWSNIAILISIIILIINKVKSYLSMTKEQQIEASMVIIKEELLKLMSDAEIEWSEFDKSGELKKSQVIKNIYEQFPILQKYISQEELVKKISDMINAQLSNMDKIINKTNVVTEETEEKEV